MKETVPVSSISQLFLCAVLAEEIGDGRIKGNRK
jgi:hypothetical protein